MALSHDFRNLFRRKKKFLFAKIKAKFCMGGFFFLLILLVSCNANRPENIVYPSSKRTTATTLFEGKRYTDPYHWLDIDTTEEVNYWMQSQNRTTHEYIQQIPFYISLGNQWNDVQRSLATAEEVEKAFLLDREWKETVSSSNTPFNKKQYRVVKRIKKETKNEALSKKTYRKQIISFRNPKGDSLSLCLYYYGNLYKNGHNPLVLLPYSPGCKERNLQIARDICCKQGGIIAILGEPIQIQIIDTAAYIKQKSNDSINLALTDSTPSVPTPINYPTKTVQKFSNINYLDIIYATELLIAKQYTNPSKIVLYGQNTLVIPTEMCFLKRPDLFKAVVAIEEVNTKPRRKRKHRQHSPNFNYPKTKLSLQQIAQFSMQALIKPIQKPDYFLPYDSFLPIKNADSAALDTNIIILDTSNLNKVKMINTDSVKIEKIQIKHSLDTVPKEILRAFFAATTQKPQKYPAFLAVLIHQNKLIAYLQSIQQPNPNPILLSNQIKQTEIWSFIFYHLGLNLK